MIKGRSHEQKKELCAALEKTLCETLGCDSKWVTVSIEDYDGKQWQDVFEKEVTQSKHLYKEPMYDPKILL
jgi:phenylpyruvate tautomerase PptA (4-oxalocrotonate tautomerase family)